MKLLQTLLKQTADNCVILTYNVDLPFFEYLLFEPLYANGCRNVTVVCDPKQYQRALADVPVLKHLGRSYACLPSTSAHATFHPKLVLLTSSEGGLLGIGSANLSRAGFTRNRELMTIFRYESKQPDEIARASFRWAFDYLRRLADDDPQQLLHERLDRLWQTTPWIRQSSTVASDDRWLLHNLDLPLLNQMLSYWHTHDGSPVEEVIIVSPYFDQAADALQALLDRVQPPHVRLITQPFAPGLDPDRVRTQLDNASVAWQAYQLPAGRRLHAKALVLQTTRGCWLLSGSANCSRPALLHDAARGNVELGVLRFEPHTSYAATILAPVLEHAIPLRLDWSVIPSDDEDSGHTLLPRYQIIRATLDHSHLTLLVEPPPPDGATIEVVFCGIEDITYATVAWTRNGSTIVIMLTIDLERLFERPVAVRMNVLVGTEQATSTAVAVMHLAELRRRSQPVERRPRTPIPAGFVPTSFEQAFALAQTLHRLLAMNVQDLERHGGLRNGLRGTREPLVTSQDDSDYDPEAMIVDEDLRPIIATSSSHIYDDFFDRLTYEELVRAALAVTYRPAPSPRTTESDGEGSHGGDPAPATTQVLVDEHGRTVLKQRLSELVKNFERGMSDLDYLDRVPPVYLQELFSVITTFLRLVWRDGMLVTEDFIDFSQRVIGAFVGDEQQVRGWPLVAGRVRVDEQPPVESRMYLPARTWLHLGLIADWYLVHAETHLPRLAQLLRWTTLNIAPNTILADLPNDLLVALWHYSFPRDMAVPDAQQTIAYLNDYSQWYDEQTLSQELKRTLGANLHIQHRQESKRGPQQISELRMEVPWDDQQLEAYWRAFTLFCRWPTWKNDVRVQIINSNPGLAHEVKRLLLSYQASSQSLNLSLEKIDKQFIHDICIPRITLQELARIEHFVGVVTHPRAVPPED